MSVLMRKKS